MSRPRFPDRDARTYLGDLKGLRRSEFESWVKTQPRLAPIAEYYFGVGQAYEDLWEIHQHDVAQEARLRKELGEVTAKLEFANNGGEITLLREMVADLQKPQSSPSMQVIQKNLDLTQAQLRRLKYATRWSRAVAAVGLSVVAWGFVQPRYSVWLLGHFAQILAWIAGIAGCLLWASASKSRSRLSEKHSFLEKSLAFETHHYLSRR